MMQGKNKQFALVFDFGGVLIDWNPRYLYQKFFDANQDAMERFLEEVSFTDWNKRQDAGRPFREAVAGLCEQFPHYDELIRAYDHRWEETIGGVIEPTVEILRSLKDVGYPLYGLSNWSLEKFRVVRPKYEFFNWFDVIVISGEVELIKPDPRIFRILLSKTGRPADECLFIDDTEANIEAAQQMGFKTIHFRSPEQFGKELDLMGILSE